MTFKKIIRPQRTLVWTREKIASLSTADVRQLRENAQGLAEGETVRLCDAVLAVRPRQARARQATSRGAGRRLVSRAQALGMRGVTLRSRAWSRGGVRPSDGAVVFAMWADDVQTIDGACHYRLWARDAEGMHPWADSPGGRERLEHCRRAVEYGGAEGMLVYGERLPGYLPEEKALSVYGVDPETVLLIRVGQRDGAYWATWGGSVATEAMAA